MIVLGILVVNWCKFMDDECSEEEDNCGEDMDFGDDMMVQMWTTTAFPMNFGNTTQ